MQMPAVAWSVCINLYNYLEKFFATTDYSFSTILECHSDKTISEIFQKFLMRFYGADVENLLSVINNLLLLSIIGNEDDQILYIYILLILQSFTLLHHFLWIPGPFLDS
jgi:hypothetical protein